MATRLLTIAIVVCSYAVPADAQFGGKNGLKWAKEATMLFEQGDYKGAVDVAQRGLDECGPFNYCRSRLRYTLGYLHQRQSQMEKPAKATKLLQQSVTVYNEVLKKHPAHWPTLSNLIEVHRRLNEPVSAITALERGLEELPHSYGNARIRGRLAMALGDIYLKEGDGERSVEAFLIAADALPMEATPKRRAVDTFALLPTDQLASKVGYLGSWEELQADVAGDGYKYIIRRLWRSSPSTAETALLRWLRLQGRFGVWSDDSLDGLSRNWEPIAELERFLKSSGEQEFRWWRAAPEREDALGAFFLALAESRREGNPRDLMRIWKGVLVLEKPPLTDIWIELYAELANSLHQLGRAKDELFEVFERRLFNAVGSHSEAFANKETQFWASQLHEALGLIYAMKGACDSSKRPELGALFHLQKAIIASEGGQEDSEWGYMPAGYLWATLADCHQSLGAQEEAQEARFSAIQAFLDADQIHLAEEQIRLAGEEGSSQTDRLRSLSVVKMLRGLATTRQDRRDQICSRKGIEMTLANQDLPAGFIDRQSFKIYADCIRFGNVSSSIWSSAELLKQLLTRDLRLSLIGAEDIVRFEAINRRILGQALLELEIVSTQNPQDSAVYIPLIFRRQSPHRGFTYIKANPEAVGQIESILENSPKIDDQPFSPDQALAIGTVLHVELLESISQEKGAFDQTYKGRLYRPVIYAGRAILEGAEVEIGAVYLCPPTARQGMWDRTELLAEHPCKWELKMLQVKVSDRLMPIDAVHQSFSTENEIQGRAANELPSLRAGRQLKFILSSPFQLPN